MSHSIDQGCPQCQRVVQALDEYFADPEQQYPYDLIRIIEAGRKPLPSANLWQQAAEAEGGCPAGEGGAG
jgi:hypothetical protein